MGAVPVQFAEPSDQARFRRTPHREGVELYRARIVHHAFQPHAHAAFGLGAIEAGVERFRYRGSEHLAGGGSLLLMNPDELHTGRAETPGGWCYRMLYLDEPVLEALGGGRDWWFATPVWHEPAAAQRVGLLLESLWRTDDPLACDGLLLDLVATLAPHARRGRATAEPSARAGDTRLARSLALMQDALAEPLTLERLADAAALSPFHYLRSFKMAHGVTPHQMLMALRMLRAKQQLAAGRPPATVAAEVGLVDQAHLTRRFVTMYGVTPGRYQRQVRGEAPASRAEPGATG